MDKEEKKYILFLPCNQKFRPIRMEAEVGDVLPVSQLPVCL